MDTSSESVWLSWTSTPEGKSKEMNLGTSDSLRIGINPEGAYNVQLVNTDGEVIKQGLEVKDVTCNRTNESSWTCKVSNKVYFHALMT